MVNFQIDKKTTFLYFKRRRVWKKSGSNTRVPKIKKKKCLPYFYYSDWKNFTMFNAWRPYQTRIQRKPLFIVKYKVCCLDKITNALLSILFFRWGNLFNILLMLFIFIYTMSNLFSKLIQICIHFFT